MNLSFIWHMHQPDYRNPDGIMQMPWVFLHAIKDYYDMPWMLAKHDGIKATFNITATLIAQLELYYQEPQKYDRFLSLWLLSPEILDEHQRAWILKLVNSTQYNTMVKEFPRYVELYNKEHISNSELIDLEILFILSWCGVYLKKNSPLIKELISKQRDYDFEDKVSLLEELSRFVSGIFKYYSKLHSEGIISLSTTPLNHPILPLLLDMNNAKLANLGTNIPKEPLSLADDAKKQVIQAKILFEKTFGFLPNGFWPAEGAVDEKSVALLRENGITWIATDEAILLKSLNVKDRSFLYTPYDYNDMCIGFRDHYLSDLIGFEYRHKKAQNAADNFMGELQKIENQNSKNTVFVILDGENAWEFYKNNAYNFFDALYKNLRQSTWCKTLTMDEVYRLDKAKLPYLTPGSWIHGEFNTWVGHTEKTRAWELIYITKRDYERHQGSLNDIQKEHISDRFLSAESSDWFWWYGDDHYTEFGAEFDELFRNHLITIYELMEMTPPSDMFLPILQHKSAGDFWLQPQSDISPNIDGKHNSFFEWLGCGLIDESKIFSTMDRQRGPVKKIFYGQDDEKLYFSFDTKIKKTCTSDFIHISIEPLNIKGKISIKNQITFIGDLEVEIACEDVLDMSIEKKLIDVDEIYILFEIEEDQKIIQTLPGFGELKINIGNDYSQNWFI